MIDQNRLLSIGNEKLRRLATFASVAVAGILIISKLVAYLMTGSVAVLSSLLDSGTDMVASLVTLCAVASALRPPDDNHRYGHGKAEPLAALAQAAFIVVASALLVWAAVQRLYHPQPVQNELIGYAAMALAICLTIILLTLQKHVVDQTGSVAIDADKLHYVGDLGVNLAVVAAFILQRLTGQDWFDPVFGIMIALGLLFPAFKILKQSVHSLMDTELPEEQRAQIIAIAEKVPGVHGVHDMRTRTDGERIFVDCHVEMDGDMSLRAAHELSVRITAAIVAAFPSADVTIHQDPAGLIEERRDTQIEKQG